jgi:hypothetical protein
VARRSPDRPADQAHSALGKAWDPALSTQGSAPGLGLAVRRDLSRRGQACPEPAEGGAGIVMPRCNSEAMSMHLEEIAFHVAPCCHAWNKLVDQPWRIMSIGLRAWAHGY